MTIWDVLKIEQTKDKDALKRAYRMRLSSVNPEDNPEGFMQLRKAYEEALRLADEEDREEDKDDATDNPVMLSLKKLYDDYQLRINPENWVTLFNTNAFVSLDTGEDAENNLLRFLLNHVLIPKKVWKVIVERFDIEANRQELIETFPENFIDYILNNAKYDDIINYEAFEDIEHADTEKIDAYIRDYVDLDRLIRKQDSIEAEKKLNEIKETYPFSNAYLMLAALRLQIQTCRKQFEVRLQAMTDDEREQSDLDKLYAKTFQHEFADIYTQAAELSEQFPDDITLLHFCGDISILCLDFNRAKQYYDRSKQIDPENYFVRAKQAELAIRTGKYKDARDMYMDLLKENHYDDNVRIGMVRANQKMIQENLEHLKSFPDDIQAKMDIGWSYYQSYQFQEAIRFLTEFAPDEERKFEYYNVLGRCYLGVRDYENAKKCFIIWKRFIEQLPDDSKDEETENKQKRYYYVNFLIADCCMKQKNYADAEKHLQISLSKEHEEMILSMEADCELKFLTGRYMECLKASETLLLKDPQDYLGYLFKAKACHKLKYGQEAYNACEQAIHLYPYLALPYAVEAALFMDAEQYVQAEDTLKRYDAFQNESDCIDYYRARLYMMRGDIPEATNLLEKVVRRSDALTTDMDHYEDLYMLLGLCYRFQDMHHEALSSFQSVKQMNPEYEMIDMYIGSSYRALGDIQKAMDALNLQVNHRVTAQVYNERAIIYNMIGDYHHALTDYQSALQLDCENYFAYIRIGMIQEIFRNFKQALDMYQRAYDISQNNREQREESMQLLARVYQCMNWFTESQNLYLLYQKEYGFQADIGYDYSVLLSRMGDVDGAISVLRDYMEDVSCAHRLIEVYGESGYVDLAHETFEIVIRRDKQDFRAYGIMGDVFRKHNLFEDAAAMYEKAIELDTHRQANYYSEWMECLMKTKPLRSIKKYIPEATIAKEHMQTPRQYIKMARVAKLSKNYKGCQELLERALHIRRCRGCFYGVCHRVLYEKALLYEKTKNYTMARKMYEEAIRVCGQNAYYEACLKRIQDK